MPRRPPPGPPPTFRPLRRCGFVAADALVRRRAGRAQHAVAAAAAVACSCAFLQGIRRHSAPRTQT
eukprot:14359528-Alexandrium_andersonii.AAC.1